jgi:hypothetical protein
MSSEAPRTGQQEDGTTDPVLDYRRMDRWRPGLERSQLSALIGTALCGAVALLMGMIAFGSFFDLDFGDFRYFAMALGLLATGGALVCAGGMIKP